MTAGYVHVCRKAVAMASRAFLYHVSRKARTSEAKAFAFEKDLCRLEE